MRCRISRSRLRPGTTHRSERAFALPIVMMGAFVVMFAGLALTQMSRMEAEVARGTVLEVQALAAAELGLERAKAMCISQKRPWSVMTFNGTYLDFYPSSDSVYQGHYICDLFVSQPAGSDGIASYSVVIEDCSDWFPGTGKYLIHAYGFAGNTVRYVTEETRTLTYASFGWLTDREDGIYFASGDSVDGWVYTNDRLNIWGDPKFTGKVNSAASYINYGHGGPPYDNPDFQQGVQLNSPNIDMAALINNGHIGVIRDRAQEANGIWLPSNEGRPYLVDFYEDGKITVRKKKTDGTWVKVIDQQDLSATNGAIYIEDTVGVRGTVNGSVTLATPQGKDIYVIDDITYASAPSKSAPFNDDFDVTDNTFDDRLGLIAGNDIVFYKGWSSTWSDMYVMASLLAVDGSIRNEYYRSSGFKNLHILGGLAQDTRGPVGMTNNCGFLKDYKYDMRFHTDPPPHFPVAMYEVDSWQLVK
jgi:hypothetical protein